MEMERFIVLNEDERHHQRSTDRPVQMDRRAVVVYGVDFPIRQDCMIHDDVNNIWIELELHDEFIYRFTFCAYDVWLCLFGVPQTGGEVVDIRSRVFGVQCGKRINSDTEKVRGMGLCIS